MAGTEGLMIAILISVWMITKPQFENCNGYGTYGGRCDEGLSFCILLYLARFTPVLPIQSALIFMSSRNSTATVGYLTTLTMVACGDFGVQLWFSSSVPSFESVEKAIQAFPHVRSYTVNNEDLQCPSSPPYFEFPHHKHIDEENIQESHEPTVDDVLLEIAQRRRLQKQERP